MRPILLVPAILKWRIEMPLFALKSHFFLGKAFDLGVELPFGKCNITCSSCGWKKSKSLNAVVGLANTRDIVS